MKVSLTGEQWVSMDGIQKTCQSQKLVQCFRKKKKKKEACVGRELVNLAGLLPHGTKVLLPKTTNACVRTAGTT